MAKVQWFLFFFFVSCKCFVSGVLPLGAVVEQPEHNHFQ